MTRSDTYKVTDIALVDRDLAGASPNLSSETFYRQDKGDEIADYTYNYQVGTLTIKSTSVFFYNPFGIQTRLQRALDADTEASMARSLAYKGEKDVTDQSIFYVDDQVSDKVALTSETYYYGDIKGEEIANYAYNYATKKNSLGTTYVDTTMGR